ncbi:AT-hook motif nuclear-localized protein 10 isoform X1 [Capsicum galapagoense]
MDSRGSTPLQHQQPSIFHETTPPNQQHVLVNDHEIMAALTPPPSQPHQKEPINDMSTPNNIFQQPNLLFSFSGKNPKTDESVVAVVGATAEPSQKKRGRLMKSVVTKSVIDGNTGVAKPSQKKRGRPRKSAVDGTGVTGATSSKNPSKKVNGRTSCSKKKRQQPEALGATGGGSMDHIIHVDIGQDIVSKIMTFLEQEQSAVCILSGVGVLCKVTLRWSETAGGTMTHEGQFDITSLSGSFIRSKSGVSGFLNLSVTSPDGSDFGGVVAGKLRAVTPVQVTLRCFSPYVEKPESKAPSSTPPPNLLNFGPPVTKASSSSQGPSNLNQGCVWCRG